MRNYFKYFTGKFCILIFFLQGMISVNSFSQNSIHGKIFNYGNGKILQGATISLVENNSTTVSDNNGNFEFKNLSSGNYTIKTSFIGFYNSKKHFKIDANKNAEINIYLNPSISELNSTVVTGTRTEKDINDIPASIEIIKKTEIQNAPYVTTDDILSSIPGLNIDRTFGLTNKSGNVTMRGLNRNVQSLILVDGIPYSLIDGSASSWNRINPNAIEKIEVLKGPGSNLYGSNAMGGVINIITKNPIKPFEASASAFYGTYNTFGGGVNVGGKSKKKFYWNSNFFYRKSDGYYLVNDSLRDSTVIKAYLAEYNGNLKLGYQFNENSFAEIEYSHSYDNRNAGSKVFEEDGSYNKYISDFARARYKTKISDITFDINLFFKNENYYKQSEGVKKKTGLYTFYNTETYSQDGGIWLSATKPIKDNNFITLGIDAKNGTLNSSDIYRTSTDTIFYKGNMNYYGLFIQDETNLFKKKLNIVAGLRIDMVQFLNGDFGINSPTLVSSFMTAYESPYSDVTWNDISPRLGIKYIFSESENVYASYSRGFRASTLSDLCRSGDVEKGFKIANPNLKPETLNNVEIGNTFDYKQRLNINAALYYSIGDQFQYFVSNGDSMYTTGTTMKPVIKRENINKVEIYGLELSIHAKATKTININLAYTYNHSTIKDFGLMETYNKDLNGKFLIDVPNNMFYAGATWHNKIANLSVDYKFKDKQWIDDQNTYQLPTRNYVNLKVFKRFNDHIQCSFTVLNLLNKVFIDAKGLLSPGRYYNLELTVGI